MEIRVKIIVNGFVQGVGYRYFCYRKAVHMGLKGYVKNLSDGSVSIEAEGESSMIKEFVKELKIGPMHSKVNSLSIEEFPFESKFDDFEIY